MWPGKWIDGGRACRRRRGIRAARLGVEGAGTVIPDRGAWVQGFGFLNVGLVIGIGEVGMRARVL